MEMWDANYDPYAALLQLQHDVEQLQFQLHNATEVVNAQSKLLQNISQHMINIAKAMEDLDRRLNLLEEGQ